MNIHASVEIVPVWKGVTSEIADELTDLWKRNGAIGDPATVTARARQAVCIARDASGVACGVGTAVIQVRPRLRQPMYFYRQFFAPEFRGHRQTIPFFLQARQVLEDYNSALAAPESLGVLIELENAQLAASYILACESRTGAVFIGYSPRGLQMRACYFKDARLQSPVPVSRGSSR